MILQNLRRQIGNQVFGRLLLPPNQFGFRLHRHKGDYGHYPHYENIFGRDQQELDAVTLLCLKRSNEILDLGGGAGRLSIRLATAGRKVTLLDRSTSMITKARLKISQLPTRIQKNITFIQSDFCKFSLKKPFETIICLNHGMEHVLSDETIRTSLRNIRRHLSGVFYFDTHFLPYWEGLPFWTNERWAYVADLRLREKPIRLWQRVLKRGDTYLWQNAIGRHGARFLFLETPLRFRTENEWKTLLYSTGFKEIQMNRGWAKPQSSGIQPKTIYQVS